VEFDGASRFWGVGLTKSLEDEAEFIIVFFKGVILKLDIDMESLLLARSCLMNLVLEETTLCMSISEST
jgi:hypothetical protein